MENMKFLNYMGSRITYEAKCRCEIKSRIDIKNILPAN